MIPNYTVLAKNLKCEVREYDDHMDVVVFAPKNIHIDLPDSFGRFIIMWINATHKSNKGV